MFLVWWRCWDILDGFFSLRTRMNIVVGCCKINKKKYKYNCLFRTNVRYFTIANENWNFKGKLKLRLLDSIWHHKNLTRISSIGLKLSYSMKKVKWNACLVLNQRILTSYDYIYFAALSLFASVCSLWRGIHRRSNSGLDWRICVWR